MMLVASGIPFPFFTPCDDMLTMLVCAARWLSMHLYTLAYMSMHDSCQLVCCPCLNTMKLWTFDPNLLLSVMNTTFCWHLVCLSSFLLACLPSFLVNFLVCPFILQHVRSPATFYTCHACHVYHAYLHYAFFIYSLHLFPSIACLLVSCLWLCMYIHRARMHGARAWSPRHK